MAASFQISGPGPIRELRVQTAGFGSAGEDLSTSQDVGGPGEELLREREAAAFEQGRIQGRAEALAEADAADRARRLDEDSRGRDRIRQLFDSLNAHLAEVERRREELLLRLVGDALVKLVGTLPARGELALSVARQCLDTLGPGKVATLFLHPEDHAELGSAAREGGPDPWASLGVPVRTCPSVGRGGCRLETDFGTLDGSVSGRLEVLREVVCP